MPSTLVSANPTVTKLIFVNRFFYPDHSATSQLLTDLAFHLVKSGSSVHVVTSRQIYDEPNAVLQANDNICGVRVTRVWATRFGRQNLLGRTLDYLTFYLSAAWSLFVLLKPGDIVVAAYFGRGCDGSDDSWSEVNQLDSGLVP
jgi:colanic acid biosynthesis glycosyl transferase WcaI